MKNKTSFQPFKMKRFELGKSLLKIGNHSGEFKEYTKVSQDLEHLFAKGCQNKKQLKLPPQADKKQIKEIRLELEIQRFGSY